MCSLFDHPVYVKDTCLRFCYTCEGFLKLTGGLAVIVKGPDEYLSSNPLARAVFYASADVLKRLPRLTHMGGGFCQLHDLRLVHQEQEAWIDHLLLHRYGFVIIESRTLCVPTLRDEQGRWFQLVGEISREVASPIVQVRRCAKIVEAVLRAEHRGSLLSGVFNTENLMVDVFVSIAKAGELITEGLGFSAVVVNAGQLAGLLNEQHERRYLRELRDSHKLLLPGPVGLSAKELVRTASYLLSQHEPLERGAKYEQSQLARYYAWAA